MIVSSRVAHVIHSTLLIIRIMIYLKCLVSCAGLKIVPAKFSFHFQGQCQTSKIKALGYRASYYITIYGPNSVNIWSKPGHILSKYFTAIPNATFK